MSDNEGGDGGKMGAFLMGFFVGVLVSLGAGGVFFVTVQRRAMVKAEMARAMAMEAHERARHALQQAEAERARAEKALELLKAKEKEAKGKAKE